MSETIVRICHDSEPVDCAVIPASKGYCFDYKGVTYSPVHAEGLRGVIGVALGFVDSRIGGYAEVIVNGVTEYRHPATEGFSRFTMKRIEETKAKK